MRNDEVATVLAAYPRIYFACHRRHVYDAAQQRAVSVAQASILDHLDTDEGVAVTELAEHMGVTVSTMSLSLDRLERTGYVERERDPTDRRRVHVRLTEAGASLRRANTVLDPELVAAMLSQLEPEERAEALRGLELLARAADQTRRQR